MIRTIEGLRALIQDASSMRPHLTGRLEKAAFLVLLRPIERLGRDLWRVGAEDGLRFYMVRSGDCECTDYVRHGSGHLCKHRIALFLGWIDLHGECHQHAHDLSFDFDDRAIPVAEGRFLSFITPSADAQNIFPRLGDFGPDIICNAIG